MKLFDNFEAIKFPEENSIFITKGGYLYYIYDSEHDYWKKYKNAGGPTHKTAYSNLNKAEYEKSSKIRAGKLKLFIIMRMVNESKTG